MTSKLCSRRVFPLPGMAAPTRVKARRNSFQNECSVSSGSSGCDFHGSGVALSSCATRRNKALGCYESIPGQFVGNAWSGKKKRRNDSSSENLKLKIVFTLFFPNSIFLLEPIEHGSWNRPQVFHVTNKMARPGPLLPLD